jgi:WXG100 family type VII secretion target
MNDITIKVTTGQLYAAAEEAGQAIDRVTEDFSSISECVTMSSNYWEGEGNKAHIQKMKKHMEKVEQILKRFKEDAEDLKTMAGVYDAAHQKTVEYTQSLSTDVII